MKPSRRAGAFVIFTLAAGLILGGRVQAQALEEVSYLLPAPPTLPAFAPWVIAQFVAPPGKR